ncbi:MAG: hypothetical protein GY847_35915 [Proteobacteria bacterium]|nr:hypothetical protein [Pseudomonadota bacterium]
MMKRIPEFIKCTGCGRRLDVEVYQAFPDEATPEEMITRAFESTYPYFSVQCSTCGHYSVFSPFKSKLEK